MFHPLDLNSMNSPMKQYVKIAMKFHGWLAHEISWVLGSSHEISFYEMPHENFMYNAMTSFHRYFIVYFMVYFMAT